MTRSPKKGKPRLTLADLAPEQTIICFLCLMPQPAAGAKPFRAHMVCAGCVPRVGTSKPTNASK